MPWSERPRKQACNASPLASDAPASGSLRRLPVEPKPPAPRSRRVELVDHAGSCACTTGTITSCAMRSIGCDRERASRRGSSSSPSAGPGSRSRSGRPGCRARCRACGPGPSAAGSSPRGPGRRCGSTGRSGSAAVWPGLEHQRRVEAGAQVEAGAAGRGVGRQLLGHARVEHACTSMRVMVRCGGGAASRCRDLGDQLARERELVGARQFALRRAASTSISALSSRPKVAGPRLPTISGTFLRTQLLARVLQQVVALGREADAERRLRQARATAARMSGFSVSSKRRHGLARRSS